MTSALAQRLTIWSDNMTKLWLDSETWSEIPITYGTHRYAASAEIMLLSWALDDGPVRVEDCTSPEWHDTMAKDKGLFAHLHDPATEIWAHNAAFDRAVMRHAWGFNEPQARWRDTMVQALSHGLPASLEQLCEVLGLSADKAKDREGRRLVLLFCKPRPPTSALRRATRETHPAEWARFIEYARQDVVAMREAHKKMPLWNYKGAELDLWHLDQRINDRGITTDTVLAAAALKAIDKTHVKLRQRSEELTAGALDSTSRTAAMIEHVAEAYGIDMPNVQMATVERMLADSDLPVDLRALLEVRLQASTTSTSKYKTLLNAVSADGRLRGTMQFNGASRTGRIAHRLFQPGNLPRPTIKQNVIDYGIAAIKAGAADLVVDNVMQLASSAVRGCIVAPKGKKLVIADLSNIEGRDQAWLAGEEWKLQAFRDFDAGTGPDLYKLAYGKTFQVDPASVNKDQRQIGKVMELALGYSSGTGGIVTFAATYGIDLEELAKIALPLAPGWAVDEATDFYSWTISKKRETYGLSRDAYITCDAIKRGWRRAHPNITAHWAELNETALRAIECPGHTFECRRIKVRRDGAWLRLGLPSGRSLCYPLPQIEDGAVTYMGVHQFTRKWTRLRTYGGKLYENLAQSVARDVMMYNMPGIEAAGYEIVLSVHDEVLCEAPDSDEFNAKDLASLLAATPTWATGMPLAAAGFECTRYRKE